MTDLQRALTSSRSQDYWLTSRLALTHALTLLCLNGSKSLQPGSKILWKSLKAEAYGGSYSSVLTTNVQK